MTHKLIDRLLALRLQNVCYFSGKEKMTEDENLYIYIYILEVIGYLQHALILMSCYSSSNTAQEIGSIVIFFAILI